MKEDFKKVSTMVSTYPKGYEKEAAEYYKSKKFLEDIRKCFEDYIDHPDSDMTFGIFQPSFSVKDDADKYKLILVMARKQDQHYLDNAVQQLKSDLPELNHLSVKDGRIVVDTKKNTLKRKILTYVTPTKLLPAALH